MSNGNSTRSGNPHYRRAARASIEIARAGGSPSADQAIALERIRVRMHGRANRHELGAWREDPAAAGGELVACIHCGAVGRLSRLGGPANVVELLEACR